MRIRRTSRHGIVIAGPSETALVWAALVVVAWSPIVAAVLYVAGVLR